MAEILTIRRKTQNNQSTNNKFLNIFFDLGIYLEAIDAYGHKYGVNSAELNNMLVDVDKTLQEFRNNLTSVGLKNDVNIVIFSDHGMINISKIVNITDAFNISDIKIIFQEPSYISIWPEEGKHDKVSIHSIMTMIPCMNDVSFDVLIYIFSRVKIFSFKPPTTSKVKGAGLSGSFKDYIDLLRMKIIINNSKIVKF